jgi:hypothetical protein
MGCMGCMSFMAMAKLTQILNDLMTTARLARRVQEHLNSTYGKLWASDDVF